MPLGRALRVNSRWGCTFSRVVLSSFIKRGLVYEKNHRAAANTMKMVSYFPVPYVAYDTVSANNAMDIGVLNQCAMDIKKGSSNLGGSACSLYLYGNANGADLSDGEQFSHV